MRRRAAVAGAVALAFGCMAACSSGGGGAKPDGGGAGGPAGTGGGAGTTGASGTTGAAGAAAGTTGAAGTPANPLCPGTALIKAGALPDGVEVLAEASQVRHMAVGGGFVYWTTETTINRVAVTGGTPAVVLQRPTDRNHLQWLAVDGATVYFAEVGIDMYAPLGVAKMPGDGSAQPTTLFKGQSPWNVLFADGYVYFYDASLAEISRLPAAGGQPTTIVRGVLPTEMAIGNGNLFYIDPMSNSIGGHLYRVPVTNVAPDPDGGAPAADAGSGPPGVVSLLATDNYMTHGVALDGTNVYWDAANRVLQLPQTGSGGTPVALDELPGHPGFVGEDTTYVAEVAAGGGNVYWSVSLGCGDVVRSKPGGADKKTLVHAVAYATFLMTDATHLYFLAGGRQLLRVPL